MNNARVLAVLITIIIVASFIQRNYFRNIQKGKGDAEVKITPTFALKPTEIPTQTSISAPTPSQRPSPTFGSVDITINNFIYPNSVRTSISMNNVVMKSNDHPQAITDWYKEKIKSLGMNINSFIQTNTNGNVLNKLLSANSGFKISVIISKKNNEVNTEIDVFLQ